MGYHSVSAERTIAFVGADGGGSHLLAKIAQFSGDETQLEKKPKTKEILLRHNASHLNRYRCSVALLLILSPIFPQLCQPTDLAFRLPPEIAAGLRRFPAATDIRDLYKLF